MMLHKTGHKIPIPAASHRSPPTHLCALLLIMTCFLLFCKSSPRVHMTVHFQVKIPESPGLSFLAWDSLWFSFDCYGGL